MKETISNNVKSISILNKLILNGHYDGKISPNRIEFSRKYGLFNSGGPHRIVGNLNKNNKYELDFEFKPPLNVIMKIGLAIGIILCLIAILNGYWYVPIPFFILPSIVIYLNFKIKERKEIRLLTSKFLELYRLGYGSN